MIYAVILSESEPTAIVEYEDENALANALSVSYDRLYDGYSSYEEAEAAVDLIESGNAAWAF